MSADRTRRLSGGGALARFSPSDVLTGAWVLEVNGQEQSTLYPEQPRRLVYDYLVRMGHAVDLMAPAGAPISALHLGGGALSLPRYVEATRPGSVQTVIDRDPELLPFVLEQFPLQHAASTTVVIGDVRDALTGLEDGPFDVVVLDIDLGPDSPARLLEGAYLAQLLALTAADGLLLINVGDEEELVATRSLVASLRAAGAACWVTAPEHLLGGDEVGNLVLGASRRAWPAQRLAALRDGGPHPSGLMAGLDLNGLGLA